MKIFLINPPLPSDSYYPPYGLMSLASMPFSSSVDINIFDYNLIYQKRKLGIKEVFELALTDLSESDCDVLGLTCNSYTLPFVYELCKNIKSKPYRLIVGGPGVSFLHSELLTTPCNIDIVVRGEGEIAFQELVNNQFVPNSSIPNISYRLPDNSVINTDSLLIENLDDLPVLSNGYGVDINEYVVLESYYDKNAAAIEIGRGCPYSCPFCSTSQMWGRRYRMKSVERVAREIELFRTEGYRRFLFIHDNFGYSHSYVKSLCNEISKLDIEWSASISLNLLNPDLMDLMANSGCKRIYLGLESGSKRILKRIPYKTVKGEKDKINKLLSTFDHATFSYVIGFPEEDKLSFKETLNAAWQYKLQGVSDIQLHPYTYLPGATDYENVKNRLHFDNKHLFAERELNQILEAFHDTILEHRNIFPNYYFFAPINLKENDCIHIIIECYSVLLNNFSQLTKLLEKYGFIDVGNISSKLIDYLTKNCPSNIDYNSIGQLIINYFKGNLDLEIPEKLLLLFSEVAEVELNLAHFLFKKSNVKNKIIRDSFVFMHSSDTDGVFVIKPGIYLYVNGEKNFIVYRLNDSDYELFKLIQHVNTPDDFQQIRKLYSNSADLFEALLIN
ncbi:MAG: radical SAM protein [Pseudomonadota bacterium]